MEQNFLDWAIEARANGNKVARRGWDFVVSIIPPPDNGLIGERNTKRATGCDCRHAVRCCCGDVALAGSVQAPRDDLSVG